MGERARRGAFGAGAEHALARLFLVAGKPSAEANNKLPIRPGMAHAFDGCV
jgi:hypothetical protein